MLLISLVPVKSEQEALDEPIGDTLRRLKTRFLSQKQLFAYLQQGIANKDVIKDNIKKRAGKTIHRMPAGRS